MAGLKRLLIAATRPEVGRLGCADSSGETPTLLITQLRSVARRAAWGSGAIVTFVLIVATVLSWAQPSTAVRAILLFFLVIALLLVVRFVRLWAEANLLLRLLPDLEPSLAATVAHILAARLD